MSEALAALNRLEATIAARRLSRTEDSYIARLLHQPAEKVLKKVAEESTEFIMAATTLSARLEDSCAIAEGSEEDTQYQKRVMDLRQKMIGEAADLQFHLQVALAHYNLSLEHVAEELARREGVSGLVEKANRPPTT